MKDEEKFPFEGEYDKLVKNVKSPKEYTEMSDEDINVCIKNGFRVTSFSRKLKVLPN